MREGAKQNIGISFFVTVHVDTVVPVTTMAETGKAAMGGGSFVVCQTGSCLRKAMVIRVTSSETPRVVERGGGGSEDHL